MTALLDIAEVARRMGVHRATMNSSLPDDFRRRYG